MSIFGLRLGLQYERLSGTIPAGPAIPGEDPLGQLWEVSNITDGPTGTAYQSVGFIDEVDPDRNLSSLPELFMSFLNQELFGFISETDRIGEGVLAVDAVDALNIENLSIAQFESPPQSFPDIFLQDPLDIENLSV